MNKFTSKAKFNHIFRIIFRNDADIMKSFFMISIEGLPDEETVKSDVLRIANPNNKTYFIGIKLKEYFVKGERNFSQNFTYFSDFVICIASKFPFFELHKKALMFISRK